MSTGLEARKEARPRSPAGPEERRRRASAARTRADRGLTLTSSPAHGATFPHPPRSGIARRAVATLRTCARDSRARAGSRAAHPAGRAAARGDHGRVRGQRDRSGGGGPLGARRALPRARYRARPLLAVHLLLDRHHRRLLRLRARRRPRAERIPQRRVGGDLRGRVRGFLGAPPRRRARVGLSGAVRLRRGHGLARRDPVLDDGERRLPCAGGEAALRAHRRGGNDRERRLRSARVPVRPPNRRAEPALADGRAAPPLRGARARRGPAHLHRAAHPAAAARAQEAHPVARGPCIPLQPAPDAGRGHRDGERGGGHHRGLPVQAGRRLGTAPERARRILRPLLRNLRRHRARRADLDHGQAAGALRHPGLAAAASRRPRPGLRLLGGDAQPRAVHREPRQGLRHHLPLHHQRRVDAAPLRARAAVGARARQGVHRRSAEADRHRARRLRPPLLQAVRRTRPPPDPGGPAAGVPVDPAPGAGASRVRTQPGRVARAPPARPQRRAARRDRRGDGARAALRAGRRSGDGAARRRPVAAGGGRRLRRRAARAAPARRCAHPRRRAAAAG